MQYHCIIFTYQAKSVEHHFYHGWRHETTITISCPPYFCKVQASHSSDITANPSDNSYLLHPLAGYPLRLESQS